MLALLLAAVLGAPPAGGLDLLVGERATPVRLGVEVRTEAGTFAPELAAWSRRDGGISAAGAGPGFRVEVSVDPAPGGARAVTAAIRWTRPAGLERAALQLSWPGAARAVRRDLRWAPLAGPERVGRGTPVLVAGGGVALAGGPGLVGARYVPADGRGGVEALLLLDDAEERPFATYTTCVDRLPESHGAVQYGALEHKRPVVAAPRRAGDVDAARATLYPLAAGVPFVPAVVERWPHGARAAIVFTDHADRTDPDALRAILWGRSDPAAVGRPGSGFLGRGLRITKTFFVHAARGGLDDPEIRPLADDLVAEGSEVALHSITPERDDRAAVRAGLAAAAPWRPVTWVDHEPYTNCEAVSNEGWRTTGPYGIRDLLVQAGIRWAWAAGDMGGFAGARVVNVLGGPPDAPHPAIYPLPEDPRLWLFESSMFYAPPAELAAALSDAALEALEREDGLFVAHTYLSASAATTRTPEHLARLAVRPAPGGGLEIDPALDAALGRIAARVRAGTLASLTWARAGGRLRALGDVEVAYRPDGAAEVRNHGDATLRGLTVAFPVEGLDVQVQGAVLGGRAEVPGETRIWFDLGPGARVVLRASERFVAVPLLVSY